MTPTNIKFRNEHKLEIELYRLQQTVKTLYIIFFPSSFRKRSSLSLSLSLCFFLSFSLALSLLILKSTHILSMSLDPDCCERSPRVRIFFIQYTMSAAKKKNKSIQHCILWTFLAFYFSKLENKFNQWLINIKKKK